MPERLSQLRREHRRQNLHVHSQHKSAQSLSAEAERVLRERLSLEYELYTFVTQRLEAQYQECRRKKFHSDVRIN